LFKNLKKNELIEGSKETERKDWKQ